MNNESVDTYKLVEYGFGEQVSKYGLNNKEFKEFLNCNTQNEIFTGVNEKVIYSLNFTNQNTGNLSQMINVGNKIWFIPADNQNIEKGNERVSFSISDKIKAIRLTERGLFLENINLSENSIRTEFYDNNIVQSGFLDMYYSNIDDFENRMTYKPSEIIETYGRDDGYVSMILSDENTMVEMTKFEKSEQRTLYSTYYEYMQSQGYYKEAQQESTKGRHN